MFPNTVPTAFPTAFSGVLQTVLQAVLQQNQQEDLWASPNHLSSFLTSRTVPSSIPTKFLQREGQGKLRVRLKTHPVLRLFNALSEPDSPAYERVTTSFSSAFSIKTGSATVFDGNS
jgi:hypothetical protein